MTGGLGRTGLAPSFSGSTPGLNYSLQRTVITLYKYALAGDASSKTAVSLANANVSVIDHAIEIDFGSGGIGGNPNTTAANGYYELDVVLPNGQTAIDHFYRLLGDVNGDGIVDQNDLNEIAAARGQSLAQIATAINQLERFRLALSYESDHAESHHKMAISLMMLGRRAEAVAALETAIRLQPDRPEPQLAMCRVFAEDGDFERSLAGIRGVLARSPRSAEAYFQLAMLLRERLPDEDFQAMTALMAHPYLSEDALAHLAFGIATVHDARGGYEEARRALHDRQCAPGREPGTAG